MRKVIIKKCLPQAPSKNQWELFLRKAVLTHPLNRIFWLQCIKPVKWVSGFRFVCWKRKSKGISSLVIETGEKCQVVYSFHTRIWCYEPCLCDKFGVCQPWLHKSFWGLKSTWNYSRPQIYLGIANIAILNRIWDYSAVLRWRPQNLLPQDS